ncbi:MAG: hypothetical protein KO206_09015 [Methanomicrobiaceae archaeon]|uniref:Uncharacterized protein n=1 Tax=hydrocarbon metagenome TaxID=938273 RepID=A0A0W8FEK3_9ZZZZ|nr:hypothetical protein [Methanomicrobiaceae archaeon]MDD5418314.1 hypothetical protein [Methanomicrobiaceae archaeon]
MPEVPQDEIGRRVFQLKKERSVDAAAATIRNTLGEEWLRLAEEDISALRRMLGDLWLYTDRKTWEKYSFSRLTHDDVRTIIRIGQSVERGAIHEKAAIDQITRMFSAQI